jgi:hypothetical protein
MYFCFVSLLEGKVHHAFACSVGQHFGDAQCQSVMQKCNCICCWTQSQELQKAQGSTLSHARRTAWRVQMELGLLVSGEGMDMVLEVQTPVYWVVYDCISCRWCYLCCFMDGFGGGAGGAQALLPLKTP